MDNQLTLFDAGNQFTVIDGKKDMQDRGGELLKCFKSELRSVQYMSSLDLFSRFNTIKAITFSYDVEFIDEIMTLFDYGEIILGGNFLVQKDTKLNELLAEICTNAYEAGRAIKNYDTLVDMLTKGDVEFRTPSYVLDHRKIYLLKSDDGKTRVIKASANMSKRAWNNDHMEHYEYDDSEECYEEYVKDFETARSLSSEVPMSVITSKKADDLVEGNAILKGLKETGRTVILQQSEEISYNNIKYTIDHEAIKEEYKAVLEGINTKSQNGFFEIIPKMIEKIYFNKKKILQKKVKYETKTETYPSLYFDFANEECKLNGDILNLYPSDDEIKQDIEELLEMYDNFNLFVGDIKKLKESHFKLMNAIFCSPFNAKLRCVAKIKGVSTSSLPLFALISSETSNSGKSFMIKAALKMMTGKELDGVKACDCSKDEIRSAQLGCKSTPWFIDEVDNSYIARLKDVIKGADKCEELQMGQMPMIVFASNNVLKPEESIRKRMIFFMTNGALPSTIDKTAYEGRGKAIIKKLGTGFYREYMRRMMNEVQKEIEFIVESREIQAEYYPDLMAKSSDIIISILMDYGYEVPEYIKHLSWQTDYSIDSNAGAVMEEIVVFCKQNRKACQIKKSQLIIELGADKSSQKTIESWKNMLPAEMKAVTQITREYSKISIDRNEFEKYVGYKLNNFFFLGRK